MTGQQLATTAGSGMAIDEEAVLRHLGIDARNPAAQALILTCQRYGLDPILKHALLIQGRLYVTRDGLLHVAHKSGKLDGIEVVEQGENSTHFVAKVAVYRKDMSKPFAYVGRYPKQGSNKTYGPEMAVKCAEVMALRRAFDVAVAAREEVWDSEEVQAEPSRAETVPTEGSAAVTASAADAAPEHSEAAGTDGAPSSAQDVTRDASSPLPLCPHCDNECKRWDSSNPKAPKWRCTNTDCTGHTNTQTGEKQPWVSWHEDPWKPGGEVDELKDPGGGADAGSHPPKQADAVPAPSSEQPQSDQRDEPDNKGGPTKGTASPAPAGSVDLPEQLAHLCPDRKLKNAALRVAMRIATATPGVKPPGTWDQVLELPASVLADVVDEIEAKVSRGAVA